MKWAGIEQARGSRETSDDGINADEYGIAGAKVHRGILCLLEETGKAPNPR